jgi:hypothetical protein
MNNIIYLENWHLAPTVITKEQLNMAVGAKLGSALCSGIHPRLLELLIKDSNSRNKVISSFQN